MRIVSTGELLWDVFPDREFLGGAPVNVSLNAQKLGNSVVLLTAIGSDERGTRAIEEMRSLNLRTDFVQVVPNQATGTAIVSIDKQGNANFVIERPAAFDRVQIDDILLPHLTEFRPDWIYFGTLSQTDQAGEARLLKLLTTMSPAKGFYDMNLREGHWNLQLVQRLSHLAYVLKLNESEAQALFKLTTRGEQFSMENFCRNWSLEYDINVICVTLGSHGCAVFIDNKLHLFAGFPVEVADTVGAGDAFAAAFLHGFHLGWPIRRTALFANALGALVASRSGATPTWSMQECLAIASISLENGRSD